MTMPGGAIGGIFRGNAVRPSCGQPQLECRADTVSPGVYWDRIIRSDYLQLQHFVKCCFQETRASRQMGALIVCRIIRNNMRSHRKIPAIAAARNRHFQAVVQSIFAKPPDGTPLDDDPLERKTMAIFYSRHFWNKKVRIGILALATFIALC